MHAAPSGAGDGHPRGSLSIRRRPGSRVKQTDPRVLRRPSRLQVSPCATSHKASSSLLYCLARHEFQCVYCPLPLSHKHTCCSHRVDGLPPLPRSIYTEASFTSSRPDPDALTQKQAQLSFRVRIRCVKTYSSSSSEVYTARSGEPAMPAIIAGINAAEPPLADSYHALLRRCATTTGSACVTEPPPSPTTEVPLPVSEYCELPMIDVGCLMTTSDGSDSEEERAACAAAMARAAEEWGFFQVRNHGVRPELLEAMRREQARLFRLPLEAKHALLDSSYRWGTPTATSLQQLSWSEAFHFQLTGLISSNDDDATCNNNFGDLNALRYPLTAQAV
ncbi:hypothetical protein PR202_gb09134 [Eleusine coracana subsp. coracana]|uniref:Non-haem dioxygenase N-terminal domain-containing protein n=1 Tax=Eleusine coracana subsp. coracana TaxID=191504 RepID=A0AAV5EH99_ELECO|nr:hypothetical protein PR202_gb09134 [Eleusine coracana subsp. coracana]